FGGSQALYDYVFIPVLTLHICLVIIGIVMAVYMIVLGFRAQTIVNGQRTLRNDTLQTSWGKVGKIFGAIAAVLIGLFLSRVMTAGFSLRKLHVYLGFLILIGIVFSIEMAIQRVWPNAERRHRALGTFTMIVYCVLFVT
ncbi:MAG: hypothetical protein ACKO9T_02020, partial [Nitrospira sp.]